MPPRRVMQSGMRKVNATCTTCGWEAHGSNAQGIAAQHADRNFGHKVTVEILQYITYIGT